MSAARDGGEEELGGGLVPVESLLHHNHLHQQSELEVISQPLGGFTLVLDCLGLRQ